MDMVKSWLNFINTIYEKFFAAYCGECCRRVCDCCYEKESEKKIHKEDIQYSFNELTPVGIVVPLTSSHEVITSHRSESDGTSRPESVSSVGTPSFYIEGRRPSCASPFIDMKSVEFWTASRESVQPKVGNRRFPSENEITVQNFQKDLYVSDTSQHSNHLSDEEKLNNYQLGQIHFGIQYFYSTGVLQVKIINARDLIPPYNFDDTRQDFAHSNPYCKLCLLPNRTDSKQTSVQRKTQNPQWDEYFEFSVPFHDLEKCRLEILVKDFDKFSRHRVIGQVTTELDDNFVKGYHTWKSLKPCTNEEQELGEIVLALNFLPKAGRLTIDIVKAKQLPQTDMEGGSDPFVKVTWVDLEKPVKTKRTSCQRKTVEPVFNESITFNVTQDQLTNASIVVTVWNENFRNTDGIVGRLVLGKYATGPHEIAHWRRMVKNPRSPVSQWHSLRSRAECDQVSPASIAVF